MKIFISHKLEDSTTANQIYTNLRSKSVDCYLDLLDGDKASKGEVLTNHIKERISECTDMLIVISEKTKNSWWVPFEIGMASQQDYPIVNYLAAGITLPEYLSYWPRLKSLDDLNKYILANVEAIKEELNETIHKNTYSAYQRESSTSKFYRILKAKL